MTARAALATGVIMTGTGTAQPAHHLSGSHSVSDSASEAQISKAEPDDESDIGTRLVLVRRRA